MEALPALTNPRGLAPHIRKAEAWLRRFLHQIHAPRAPRVDIERCHVTERPMTEREKYLSAKIASLEAENRRLFRFETAVLQIRDILAANLPPNCGLALQDGMADIVSIIEEAGFPFSTHDVSADGEAPAPPEANVVPFPFGARSLREH